MSDSVKIPADIKKLSFEQAMEELETIVHHLEHDSLGLEDSIQSWTRAMALRLHCENLLSNAKLKVEKIMQASDGSIKMEKFDAHEDE